MSTPVSQAIRNRRVRYVYNEEGRLIEIRQFDKNGDKGDYCFSLVVKRDETTKAVIGWGSRGSKINDEDLAIMT